MDKAQPLLQVERLSLAREGRQILRDVNLELLEGEIHVLLGLNGSGKSSLAYAVMGCGGYVPDSGYILFAGQHITRLPIHERARLGLTLAWQEPARLEGLSVSDYLALSSPEASPERLSDGLRGVALSPTAYLRRFVDQALSGGERKRIELAAVFFMRPRLAILDEPDSGIDVLTVEGIQQLIKRMSAQGTTVLLITHRNEMAAVADRASLMCEGTIVRTGAPGQISTAFESRCLPHGEMLGSQPWLEPCGEGRG